MFQNIIHSDIGLFHTIVAFLSMLFGTMIVLKTKGTTLHKRLGYLYVICMLLLNISSFFIVNFGKFSFFHGLAVFSLITVLVGIIPTFLRVKDWMYFHFYALNWSVVGLYCAFWAELGTRFAKNSHQFWWIVFLAMIITSVIGGVFIHKKAKELHLK